MCKGDTNSREIFWKIPSISLKHAHSRACKRALTQPPTRAEAAAAVTATAKLSLASVTQGAAAAAPVHPLWKNALSKE